MSKEISFCPLCAGKVDSESDDKFQCEDCETQFLIQIVSSDDDDEEDDDDDDDDDERDDEEDDEEEAEDKDDY